LKNMTTKLYVSDPYIRNFDATVAKIINDKKVVLDQTCFYPEAGGQVGDKGKINGMRVVDTQYENGKIVHILERDATFREGDKVSCEIDWERRYKIMKLHSAAHFAYYVFIDLYGKHKVIGSNVTDIKSRVDFQYSGSIDEEEVSKRLNDIIRQNLEIKTWSKSSDPNFRYWKPEGFPKMPCGGTHPKNTSEIGYVEVKRKSLGKQGRRIYLSLK
jgi:Ser-tRNA(Ala) deacylase AlaX